MDQRKIGRLIAERRKANGLTQAKLAETLGVTDRAVSKWENGKAMPDSSIMLELCEELKITVNDLLSGEVVTMNEYNEKQEQILLDMVKQKENSDKRLLSMEILIGLLSTFILLSMTTIASFLTMDDWLRVVLIILGFVPCLIGLFFAIKIEQEAGYYECAKCGHRYVPTFGSVLMAMHFGRTRYMSCPHCHERSWQKKVLSKEK